MEYFLLKSNVKTPLCPIIRDNTNYPYRLTEENYNRLPKSEVYNYFFKEDMEKPELLTQPTFMLGDSLKSIISLYDDSVEWKSFHVLPVEGERVLEEKVLEESKHYWIPKLTRLKCLHSDVEIQPNGAVTTLILDKNKLRNMDIFQVEETQENYVLVSLALAESISRRHPYGVRLERVEVR